jgi:Tfp pilus assembly protein PilX
MRKVKNLYPLERGFALPLGIAVGLIMLMIAITMIIRSNQTQVISLSQRQTNSSLSAAETGVAKFQALLNQYREYATYSYCPPTPPPPSPPTPPPSPTNPLSSSNCRDSWTDLITQVRGRLGCSSYNNPPTDIDMSHENWKNIEVAGQPDPGRYRLVEYRYTPNDPAYPNRPNGVGTLVVEGEALYPDGSGTGAITRLTVKVPVVVDGKFYSALTTQVPPNPATSSNYLPVADGRPFQAQFSSVCPIGIPSRETGGITINTPVNNTRSFPGPDKVPTQTVYSYQINPGPSANAIELEKGEKITIEDGYTVKWNVYRPIKIQEGEIYLGGGAKLIIYTDQSITMRGPTGGSVLPPIQNQNPNYFQIYQSGRDPDPTAPGNATGELTIVNDGINPVRLFVYAPESTVTFQGGPNKAGGFFATVWANNFNLLADPATPTSFPVFEQADVRYDPDNPDLSIAIGPLFQQLQPISSWERTQSTASAPSPSPSP